MPETYGWPLRQAYGGGSREATKRTKTHSPDADRIRRAEGNNRLDRRLGVEKSADAATLDFSEENMSKLKLRKSSSQKVKLPIKMLIEEEMSNYAEQRRSSPNIVARLMGLDELPTSRPVHTKHRKDPETLSHGINDTHMKRRRSFQNNPNASGNHHQIFKDVYEDMETSKFYRHQNRLIEKGLRKSTQRENDNEITRQKFVNANHLAVDGKRQKSKDFRDALEVRDSNKDAFLNLLQEPNSLVNKHLKSSNLNREEDHERQFASGRNFRNHSKIAEDVMNFLHKYNSDHPDEEFLFAPGKLPRSRFEGERESNSLSTRIVVLKPTLKKNKITNAPSSCEEKEQFGHRKQKEYQTSHRHKPFLEVKAQQKFIPRYKDSYSQISKETLKVVKKANKPVVPCALASEYNYRRNEYSQKERGKSTLLDAGFLTSEQYDDDSIRSISSPFHSSDSSGIGEARKQLSEGWRISNRSQNAGSPVECSATLGEKLSFPARKKPDVHLSLGCHLSTKEALKNGNPRKLRRSRSLPASAVIPANSRRSNRTGSFGDVDYVMLKDVLGLTSKKSPKEKDQLHQNTMSPQRGEESNKYLRLDTTKGEESQLPDEQYHKECLTVDRNVFSAPSAPLHLDSMALIDDYRISSFGMIDSEKEDNKVPSGINKEYLVPVTSLSSESIEVADVHNTMISKECPQAEAFRSFHTSEPESPKEFNSYVGEEECSESPLVCKEFNSYVGEEGSESSLVCKEFNSYVGEGSESPLVYKDSDHSSPVSVLDTIKEEESSPECFEKVNADLQGLRLQLQLLKLESKCPDVERMHIFDDEESGGDGVILQTDEMLSEVSADGDERDFSYLIDMLANAGLHDSVIETVSSTFALQEYPVASDVFGKLEKVYDEPSWPRAERKLLFDLINSVLMELLSPHMGLHPTIKPRSLMTQGQMILADEAWQSLVKKRQKEFIDDSAKIFLDNSWLDLSNITYVMGGEMEKMLGDDLFDEVVYELLFEL